MAVLRVKRLSMRMLMLTFMSYLVTVETYPILGAESVVLFPLVQNTGNSMSQLDPEEQLAFLTKLQRILNEGIFVATYEYALLQSIAGICPNLSEKFNDSRRAERK